MHNSTYVNYPPFIAMYCRCNQLLWETLKFQYSSETLLTVLLEDQGFSRQAQHIPIENVASAVSVQLKRWLLWILKVVVWWEWKVSQDGCSEHWRPWVWMLCWFLKRHLNILLLLRPRCLKLRWQKVPLKKSFTRRSNRCVLWYDTVNYLYINSIVMCSLSSSVSKESHFWYWCGIALCHHRRSGRRNASNYGSSW